VRIIVNVTIRRLLATMLVALVLESSCQPTRPRKANEPVPPSEGQADKAIEGAVESLRNSTVAVSSLSSYLRGRKLAGVVTRRDGRQALEFAPGSAQDMALVTHTYLLLVGDSRVEQAAKSFASDARYTVKRTKSDSFFLYPAVLEDEMDREFMALVYLEHQTAEFLMDRLALQEQLAAAMAESDDLMNEIGSQQDTLKHLDSRAQDLQRQFEEEQRLTNQLQQELTHWLTAIDANKANRGGAAPTRYSPEDDPSLPVLREVMVPISEHHIPYVPWDGTNGVPTPYLDKEMAERLGEFFRDEQQGLRDLGATGLALESAARTPVRGLALGATNPRAVSAFSSNHVIGTAVDFGSAALFDYSNPNLSRTQKAQRLANHQRLAGLLSKHGIVLGTTGADGRPDPMHATLSSTAGRSSAGRLTRLSSIIGRYAQRYAQVRSQLAAKQAAAKQLQATLSASVQRMGALIADAEQKCSSLEAALGTQKQTNARLTEQISACKRTFDSLKAMRESPRRNRSNFDARDLAERAERGEDVGPDIERMYHDTLERAMREHESCTGTFGRDDEGRAGFEIRCGSSGDDGEGGVRPLL
jgi:peptidoglycan hydrolase CwlO-like protein